MGACLSKRVVKLRRSSQSSLRRRSQQAALPETARSSSVLKTKTYPIVEDYVISKQQLGCGVNGVVLLCTKKSNRKKYALKKLKDTRKSRREIDLQWRAAQNCNNIVRIVDVYENTISAQSYFLVVMEYMEGGELFEKITKSTFKKTPFTEQEVAKIMIQICSAVRHLHSMDIAHRDLKPENLLYSKGDDEHSPLIKLGDFGFAKESSKGLTTPNFTPYYVAPEILRSENYDISCDIWSLGVIMYILCCGKPPFYSVHNERISPGMVRRIKNGEFAFAQKEWATVSDEAKHLIQGMLETVPQKRMKIDDVMQSRWIANWGSVPSKPLPTVKVLKEEREKWPDVNEDMRLALSDMRIDWDRDVKMKEISEVKNPLLERRRKKTPAADAFRPLTRDLKAFGSMPIRITPITTALHYSVNLADEEKKKEKAVEVLDVDIAT